jgi:hypothetical protein
MKVAIPTQSIALMRICTAILLCISAVQMHIYAHVLFAPTNSLFPLEVAIANERLPSILAILYANNSWYHVCFGAIYFGAIGLLLGYRYQLACAISFVALLLIQLRNPYILQGGDDLLRLILLWLILLPANSSFAIQHKPLSNIHHSVWLGYVFQVAIVYASSAWHKGAEWNQSFTAIQYTFAHQGVARQFVTPLLQYPSLLSAITAIVYYAEWMLPMLLIVGIWHKKTAHFAAIGLFMFHLINAVTLNIGLFPWVGIVSLIPLLPLKNSSQQVHQELKNRNKIEQATHLSIMLLILGSACYLIPSANRGSASARIIRNAGLYQRWDMFAPGVSKVFVRFVMIDELAATEQPHTFATQPHEEMFKKDRFRKFSEYASDVSHSYLAFALCKCLVANDTTYVNKTLYMIRAENKMGRVMHTTHEFVYLANCNY